MTARTKKQYTPVQRASRKARFTAKNHLDSSRKASIKREKWGNLFPLLDEDEYETAPNGLISVTYDEKQFRQWVPLEPFSDLNEHDCVIAACVAIRIHSHKDSLAVSRMCNRREEGILLLKMPEFIGIPNTILIHIAPEDIYIRLEELENGKATLLTVGYEDGSFHTCLVYRSENSILFIFEPQQCWYTLRRFPVYAMQDWDKITEFLLLYDKNSGYNAPDDIDNEEHDDSDNEEPDDSDNEEHDDKNKMTGCTVS